MSVTLNEFTVQGLTRDLTSFTCPAPTGKVASFTHVRGNYLPPVTSSERKCSLSLSLNVSQLTDGIFIAWKEAGGLFILTSVSLTQEQRLMISLNQVKICGSSTLNSPYILKALGMIHSHNPTQHFFRCSDKLCLAHKIRLWR